jgi:S1-C subfamily serine protease
MTVVRLHTTIVAALVMLASTPFAAGQGAPELRTLEKSFKSAVANAEASIACIYVSRRDQDPEKLDDVPEYFGSGVVIDHRLVLTCYHVVRDSKSIVVVLAGQNGGEPRRSRATIYAADNRSDLAVLILDNQRIETPPIRLGRGEDLVKGSFVIGLSHPFAASFREGGPSASWGIVSNLRRRLSARSFDSEHHRSIHNYGTLIETDSRVAIGSSGGALVDLDGKLVGLTTAQAALAGSDSAGAFAVPIDAGIRRIIEVLRKGEEVEYGFLGVYSDNARNRRNTAVAIRGITLNSPAYRAGLRPGDVVLQVDGQPIRESDDLFLHVGLGLAGREITIQVLRPGESQPRTLKATLAKLNNPDFGVARNRPGSVRGLWVDFPSVNAFGGDQAMPDGVVVREVEKGSPAELAKLGDYTGAITEINGVSIHTPAEFYREAEKATRGRQPIRLQLADNPPRTVVLP